MIVYTCLNCEFTTDDESMMNGHINASHPDDYGELRAARVVEWRPESWVTAVREGLDPMLIATLQSASKIAVADMIQAPVGDEGRSEWLWIRLPNGDLLFGCFPRGDTYFQHEGEREV